jgi:hypothetical protein
MADTTPRPADKPQIDRIEARARTERDGTRTEAPAPSVGRSRPSWHSSGNGRKPAA